MEQLGAYFLSLMTAAMVCGFLLSLLREGNQRTLLRMVCGIFLALTALSPLKGISFEHLPEITYPYLKEGEALAARGAEFAAEEKRKGIQTQLEAYILDKAAELEAEIRPEITVDEDGKPVKVSLHGNCSSGARQVLSAVITNDLGILEEDQKWTGQK